MSQAKPTTRVCGACKTTRLRLFPQGQYNAGQPAADFGAGQNPRWSAREVPAVGDQHMITAGRVSAAGQVSTPDVPAAAGRKGFKAELDGLRERMRGLGFSYDEIAAEIGTPVPVRPREAYRLAWGWSLNRRRRGSTSCRPRRRGRRRRARA